VDARGFFGRAAQTGCSVPVALGLAVVYVKCNILGQ
jgi:hypothetical protein